MNLASLAPGIVKGVAGYARGRVAVDQEERERAERAKLQAAQEFVQRQQMERQNRLDTQQSQRYALDDARSAAAEERQNARTAADMAGEGFTRFRPGMMQGNDAAFADGVGEMGASSGTLAPMMGAASTAIRAKAQVDAPAIASAQGGFVKTGMSQTERMRQDQLEQQREIAEANRGAAQQRAEADRQERAERARETNATRTDLARIAAAARTGGNASGMSPRAEAQANKLRQQYEANPAVKQAYTIANQMQAVEAGASNPDAAGDLSMIFAYMKILDPNSVVRETEFANAQNAAGVPDQIRNAFNRVKSGERLNPAQRTQFVARARQIGATYRSLVQQQNARYAKVAKAYGVDPELVIGDPFETLPSSAAPAQASSALDRLKAFQPGAKR